MTTLSQPQEQPAGTLEEDMDQSFNSCSYDHHQEFVEILKATASSSEEDPSSSEQHENSNTTINLQKATKEFETTFHHKPQFVARSPGRINLVGEHIDYNGFGVLPMALEQSIFVACSSNKNSNQQEQKSTTMELELHSTSPEAQMCQHVCNIQELPNTKNNSSGKPPFETHQNRDWSHYVLSAFYGVLEVISNNKTLVESLAGQTICLLVHGSIPQGAGLSSSSALVVSSALAFLSLFDQLSELDKTQIASLCARCERWVGTEGGGMDQAISLFAQAGSACYIQFQPLLSHKVVPLPPNTSWVVCHSLHECHKRGNAATHFNKRVVECKLGCRMLAQFLDWEEHHQQGFPETLWELVGKTGLPLGKLEAIVRDNFKNIYTRKEIIRSILGDKVLQEPDGESSHLDQLALSVGITSQAGKEALAASDEFHIRDRLLHVYTESQRVQEFVAHCSRLPVPSSSEKDAEAILLADLGALLIQSHKSCSEFYDCSSPQVDKLQEVCAIGPGAVGVRMTGAGWGGSVISLVRSKEVDAFCVHVRKRFYERLSEPPQQPESEYMFVTKPAQGSNVFSV